jgi:hypothetical protein
VSVPTDRLGAWAHRYGELAWRWRWVLAALAALWFLERIGALHA